MDKDSLASSFINILQYIAETERYIEIQRNAFAYSNSFDSFGFFRYLDKTKKNYISLKDIINFLSLTQIKYSTPLIKEIVRAYDKDKDTCWNYEEFCLFSGTKDTSYFSSLSSQFNSSPISCSQAYNKPMLQEEETLPNCEKELSLLFKMEIAYLEYLGIKIKAFKALPYDNITPNVIYDLLKGSNSSLDFNELYFFIKKYNSKILSDDVKLILKRLTRNVNGIITLSMIKNIFSYDTMFITQEMTEYNKTKGYFTVNPIYPTESLYYTSYYNHKNNFAKTHLSLRSTASNNTKSNSISNINTNINYAKSNYNTLKG